MALDLTGNIVIAVQILALVMLVVGVCPYRIRTKNRNLIMHGFLAITAVVLNLITVFYVMVPVFSEGIAGLIGVSMLGSAVVVAHAVLGTAAIVSGLIIIATWVTHPLGELGCNKMWKWMMPTFAVWATSLVLGAVIHIFEII